MEIILVLHSLVRWFILLFGLWALINGITGVVSKRSFTAADRRSGFLFMLSCDIQFLLGLVLYFGNGWFSMLKDNAKEVMQNDYTRFFAVEHATMMVLAWILVHIGKSSVKKATTDAAKHKKMLIFFGLAIVLIIAAIPWPFRENIGWPWFVWFR